MICRTTGVYSIESTISSGQKVTAAADFVSASKSSKRSKNDRYIIEGINRAGLLITQIKTGPYSLCLFNPVRHISLANRYRSQTLFITK